MPVRFSQESSPTFSCPKSEQLIHSPPPESVELCAAFELMDTLNL